MVVRIIYRPSYPRMTVAHSAAPDLRPSIQSEPAPPTDQPAADSRSRSHKRMLRSLALNLVRLGFGAMVMAAWRIAADLGLPLPFVIKTGVLIHWQLWFGGGVLPIALAGTVARRRRLGSERGEESAKVAEEAA